MKKKLFGKYSITVEIQNLVNNGIKFERIEIISLDDVQSEYLLIVETK